MLLCIWHEGKYWFCLNFQQSVSLENISESVVERKKQKNCDIFFLVTHHILNNFTLFFFSHSSLHSHFLSYGPSRLLNTYRTLVRLKNFLSKPCIKKKKKIFTGKNKSILINFNKYLIYHRVSGNFFFLTRTLNNCRMSTSVVFLLWTVREWKKCFCLFIF